jgi:hypothetical protein
VARDREVLLFWFDKDLYVVILSKCHERCGMGW